MTEGISPAWDGDIPAVPRALGTGSQALLLSPQKAGTGPGQGVILAKAGRSGSVFVAGWVWGRPGKGQSSRMQRWGWCRARLSVRGHAGTWILEQ